MSAESIIERLKEVFVDFNESLQKATDIITKAPESNSTIWETVSNMQNVIIPIALTLAVLYFFMGFLKQSIMFQYMRWENVVKTLLRIILAKVLIENTMTIMTSIFAIGTEIVQKMSLQASASISDIKWDALENTLKNLGPFDRMGYWIQTLPISLIMFIVIKVILLVVYGRMIQIYIYTMFAPIPLATIAGEGFGDTAKNFLKDYAAVCLQGAVMIGGIHLYGAILRQNLANASVPASMKGFGEILLMSIILLFVLVKSSDWSKKIIGN
ncbi:VirB6/TrbL-like conjugal transfer protein, CD1112 family [Gemella morbillorum]